MMAAGERCLVVTFASTHDAISAEKALDACGVEGRIIPTPVAVTSDCGLSWKSPLAEKDALEEALKTVPHDEVLELVL